MYCYIARYYVEEIARSPGGGVEGRGGRREEGEDICPLSWGGGTTDDIIRLAVRESSGYA